MGEYSLLVSRLIFDIFSILNGCRAALMPSPEDVKKFVVNTSLSVARFWGISLPALLMPTKSSNFPVNTDFPYRNVGNRKYLISSEHGMRTV